ncbi:MAG: hypothetical protein PHN69_06760 [Candidatus Pacebacteria bacterium]|nr:hypothetical protein [Candidatus Paceibacterota bacterium]
MTLATLRGSEKQVAWAENIRDRQLTKLANLIEEARARVENEGNGVNDALLWILNKYEQAFAVLETYDSAKFWIENPGIVTETEQRVIAQAIQIQEGFHMKLDNEMTNNPSVPETVTDCITKARTCKLTDSNWEVTAIIRYPNKVDFIDSSDKGNLIITLTFYELIVNKDIFAKHGIYVNPNYREISADMMNQFYQHLDNFLNFGTFHSPEIIS